MGNVKWYHHLLLILKVWDGHNNETEDEIHYSMAARNYSHLPKSILDKMKEQHNATKDED